MSLLPITLEVQNNLPELVNNSSPDSNILNPNPNMKTISEYQGDQIEEKRNEVFYIGFININGIQKTTKKQKNKE